MTPLCQYTPSDSQVHVYMCHLFGSVLHVHTFHCENVRVRRCVFSYNGDLISGAFVDKVVWAHMRMDCFQRHICVRKLCLCACVRDCVCVRPHVCVYIYFFCVDVYIFGVKFRYPKVACIESRLDSFFL